jgi:hypothetical protein|tara:strand:+ start:241 stop:486 length:246 start_codon:yes stop_codon:yes gene_type:complete
LFGDDFGFDEEAEPVVGFACFLAGDIHLCGEVRFALACLGFLDVCSDRCSRAKELIFQGSGNSRLVFKLLADLYDPNCKIE